MFEQGGTAIVTHSRSSAHTIASGGDSRKMGRWNWVTLRGKDQIMTTIISIYRPRAGQETSHRQLGRLRGEMDGDIREIQPQQMWKKDIADLIREKKTARHEVIVAGDFNDDLNDERGTIEQFMAELGLRNLIKEINGPGPNTYSRGTTSIDGAYGTPRIKLKQGGYSSFDESPSDHLVGIGREDRPPPMLRKATSKIPSVKRQFNELLEIEVKRHKLKEKMQVIFEHAQNVKELTEVQYEKIEERIRIRRVIKKAEKNCRICKRKQVPFSTKQKRLMGAIRVLQMVRLRFLMTGSRNRPRAQVLSRMANKYKYKD
jgi:hypothetical protein